jgi:DNA-binding NarL/FixJ family response regulator
MTGQRHPSMSLVRILVVEDHAPFRRLICTALQRRAEFRTIEAADGSEAVQKAEDLRPDVILLDINLPKLNGFAVAARIRTFAPHTPLIFLSQESSADIVREAFRLGAHGYVHKHRAARDLLPAIDAAVGGHRHEIVFCSDDAAIVDGLTRFVATAVNAADAALVLVTESHRQGLLQRLRAQGVDIDLAIQRGTYLSLDAEQAPEPAQFLEAINGLREAAVKAGKVHPRIAFCGERAGRLWAQGRTAEAVQLEQFCDELAPEVDILCLYPLPRKTDDEALERICTEHTAVSSR